MEIRLTPTTIGNLSVNRLAVLNTTFFYAAQLTAQYNFVIYLVDDNWQFVDSSYVTTVPQTATITGTDYEPAFNSFAYAQPLIQEQAANW